MEHRGVDQKALVKILSSASILGSRRWSDHALLAGSRAVCSRTDGTLWRRESLRGGRPRLRTGSERLGSTGDKPDRSGVAWTTICGGSG